MKVIHEKQRLQLCGLHTINNLLQLSDPSSGDQDNHNSHHNKVLKSELDEIADQITMKELQLFKSCDFHENSCSPNDERLTLFQKWWSHHRTPLFGNYSYEVLESVLKRRGVYLTWYNQKDMIKRHENDKNSDMDVEMDGEETIGFVLNESRVQNSILRFVPILKNARHWFCIIKFPSPYRRKYNSSKVLKSDCKYGTENNDDVKWIILNSIDRDYIPLPSKFEMLSFIQNIQEKGGSVFTAKLVPNLIR